MVLATLLEGAGLLFFIKFKIQTSNFKLTGEKFENEVLYSEFGVFSSSLSEMLEVLTLFSVVNIKRKIHQKVMQLPWLRFSKMKYISFHSFHKSELWGAVPRT